MSIIEYVRQMKFRQDVIAEKLGVDLRKAEKVVRVLNLSLLVLLAVPIKVLVDKGIISDAELITVLNQARDAGYDDEPVRPPPNGQDGQPAAWPAVE